MGAPSITQFLRAMGGKHDLRCPLLFPVGKPGAPFLECAPKSVTECPENHVDLLCQFLECLSGNYVYPKEDCALDTDGTKEHC